MNVFETNLKMIQSGFPELYERLVSKKENEEVREDKKIYFEQTLTTPCLSICNTVDKSKIRLNSIYDPEYAANVWCRGLNHEEKKKSNLFLVGLGNGSYARALVENMLPTSRLLIYEPSASVFRKTLRTCDLSLFFSTPGVRVIIKDINEDMSSGVFEEMLTIRNYEDSAFFISPNYGKVFPQAAKRIARIYREGVGVVMSNRNTIRRFINYSPYNQLYNIRYLEKNTVVPYLAENWKKDVPVLIVGAGPSLKEDIHVIKELREFIYVFAVDSALNYLLLHDVIPDMFISIEPKKDWKYFKDSKVKDIPMFAKLSTNYEVLKAQKAPIVFGYEEELAERIYDAYHIPKSKYRYGGNGATSLFAICKELGVQTVVLVGQDMAYGENHQSHIHKQSEAYEEEECFLVEGNSGRKVQSRQDWYRFAKWYENAIPVCKFQQVINTAKEGVKIQGTQYMPLRTAIEKWGKRHIAVEDVLKKTKTIVERKHINMDQIYKQLTDELNWITTCSVSTEELHGTLIYGILQLYEMAEEEPIDDHFSAIAKKLLKYLKEGIFHEPF